MDELVEELIALEANLAAWEDWPEGPYFHEDGTLWRPGKAKCCAPAHHPRRCHSTNRHGARCGRWAERGREHCKHHGGRRPLVPAWSRRMPSKYTKVMMPALAARLEAFLGSASHAEQLQIYDEIALARVMLENSIALWSAIEPSTDPRITAEMKGAARMDVQRNMDVVTDLCARMARIEKDLSDKVSVRQLGMFVEQIARVIHARLGDSGEADMLIEDLRSQVRLPADPQVDPQIRVQVELE